MATINGTVLERKQPRGSDLHSIDGSDFV